MYNLYNIWAGLKSQLYLDDASCFTIRGAPTLVLITQLKIRIETAENKNWQNGRFSATDFLQTSK